METTQKFDIIHYANNPDEWQKFKDDHEFEDKLKEIADFLEIQIKENFANFNPYYVFMHGLYVNGHLISSEKMRMQLKYKFEFTVLDREISKEFTFDSNKNSEILGNYVNNDFINFEGKDEQKYKDDFIEIYSFINYYLGCTNMLISETDIIVKILGEAKSYKGFKNLKNLNLYKNKLDNYIKEKNRVTGLLNENLELYKKNENIKKQRGTFNQYFQEWEAESLNLKQGDKITFYNNEFRVKYPDLKQCSYTRFSANFRKSKSNDLKALRPKK